MPTALHYFPLSSPFLLLLAALVAAVIIFMQLDMLCYAYEELGMPLKYFYALLAASLLGSYTLSGERVMSCVRNTKSRITWPRRAPRCSNLVAGRSSGRAV